MNKKGKGKQTGPSDINDEDYERYENAFNKIVKGKKGEINFDGVLDALEEAKENYHREDVEDAAEAIGKNEFMQFSFDDFLQMIVELRSPAGVEEAFKVFDRDNNGYITAAEFKYALKLVGTKLTDKQIDDIFKISDVNADGKLDYQEFVNYWHSQ